MNQNATPTLVMREIGRTLVNNLKFAGNVSRAYDDRFKMNGGKVGWTVYGRLPQRYIVNKGAAITPQAVTDNLVPVTLTDQANIAIEFNMASLQMEIDDYSKRYVDPQVEHLANQCDWDGLSRMTKETFRAVGTPGVVPGSTGTLPMAANDVYLLAGVRLTEGGVPTSPRNAVLNAGASAQLMSANSAIFNPSQTLEKNYRKGRFGVGALGVDQWYEDENTYTHQVGPLGGTPLMNGATAEGATSVVTNGWTAAAALRLRAGDSIQIAGVYEINPQHRQSTGRLMDFVVTADVYSDGAGNATIPVYPPIKTAASGPFDTVNALPLTGAAITIFNHASSHANKQTRQGLLWHPDAYALVMADLEMPGGVWVGKRISNAALGIAVRFLKDYNIMTDQSPARCDILYGWKATRPEMATRICLS